MRRRAEFERLDQPVVVHLSRTNFLAQRRETPQHDNHAHNQPNNNLRRISNVCLPVLDRSSTIKFHALDCGHAPLPAYPESSNVKLCTCPTVISMRITRKKREKHDGQSITHVTFRMQQELHGFNPTIGCTAGSRSDYF